MWWRVSDGRVQNLVTGVEFRTRSQGGAWQVVCESPATTPPTNVLASGFSNESNANAAMAQFLIDNNISVAQPVPFSSITTSKEL